MPAPGFDNALEFRQVGDTWVHVDHIPSMHNVRLAIVNEETQNTEFAELTTAMARQLRDWLNRLYPR